MATQSVGFTYVIKQLELALRPRFVDACARGGLTAAQFTALTVLQRRPGTTSSELARRSFVRAQTMAATVDPLIEGGLVRREQDPAHGRRQLLFLTPQGEEMISRLSPDVAAIEEEMLADLSPAERGQLADLLRRCRRGLA